MLGRPCSPSAGVQEIIGVGVLGELRRHRAHDAQVVDALGDVREQIADRHAALPVACWNFQGDLSVLPMLLNCVGSHLHLERLAVLPVEPRLGVERVDLRRPAVHVEKDDVFGPRWKMTGPSAAGS